MHAHTHTHTRTHTHTHTLLIMVTYTELQFQVWSSLVTLKLRRFVLVKGFPGSQGPIGLPGEKVGSLLLT